MYGHQIEIVSMNSTLAIIQISSSFLQIFWAEWSGRPARVNAGLNCSGIEEKYIASPLMCQTAGAAVEQQQTYGQLQMETSVRSQSSRF